MSALITESIDQKTIDKMARYAMICELEQKDNQMLPMNDDTRTINTHPAGNPMAAALDVQARSNQAFLDHQDFFTRADIQARIDQTYAIVNRFFPVRKDIYVNYRANRGKPFVVIKVDYPKFPNVKPLVKQETFVGPLDSLNVERVFSNNTNSWLFYIR
jgi:hypothetical protein